MKFFLALAAVGETTTGLALPACPSLVIRLLFAGEGLQGSKISMKQDWKRIFAFEK